MHRTTVTAFAIVAAVAIGAIGYAIGMHQASPPDGADRATVEAMVAEAIAARSEATPSAAAPSDATPFTPLALNDAERSAVEGIVRDYLMANPEVIRDAINELQRREDMAAQVAQTQAISDNGDLIFNSDREVVLGNPDGDVTLVEFFDYNCTYCRRGHADMKNLIALDPNLRVVLKQFPVLGEGSVQAAQVGEAVRLVAPEKYEAFHDAMLAEKGAVDGARALAVAEEIGLDPEVLRGKLSDPEIQETINEAYDLAGKLNLTGTPSYVTRKEVIVGAVGYDALRARLDDARACAQAATC